VDRIYWVEFEDQLGVKINAGFSVEAMNMQPDETIILRHSMEGHTFIPASASVKNRGVFHAYRQAARDGWGLEAEMPTYDVARLMPLGPDDTCGAESACSTDSDTEMSYELAQPAELGSLVVSAEGGTYARHHCRNRLKKKLSTGSCLRTKGLSTPESPVDGWQLIVDDCPCESVADPTSFDQWSAGYDVSKDLFDTNVTNLVLQGAPIWCLDTLPGAFEIGTEVGLFICNPTSSAQLWLFDVDGRLTSLNTAVPGLCVQVTSDGVPVLTNETATCQLWDGSFHTHRATPSSHGAFYFTSAGPHDRMPEIGSIDYRNPNRDYVGGAFMDLVVAGNTTVSSTAYMCPPEGCDKVDPSSFTSQEKEFFWSDEYDSSLLGSPWRLGNDDITPTLYGDTIIPKDWTVHLDVETVLMNKLTIEGTLVVVIDSSTTIKLHAINIDIRGGALIFGNTTHPVQGQVSADRRGVVAPAAPARPAPHLLSPPPPRPLL